jgi:hypothetical protein
MFSCQCESHWPARWRNVVVREGVVIETSTVHCRCMGYEHCINPGINNFLFNKLMFTSLDDTEVIGVIVSVATFDVVVVIIADFVV